MKCLVVCLVMSSPSFALWGQTHNVNELAFQNDIAGVHFFYPNFNTGVSFTPIRSKHFRAGLLYTAFEFPRNHHSNLNVVFELGFEMMGVWVGYTHISNAYTGILNHGVDMIRIRL